MPVSHLGLTVSHIPSATSFYLSTLRPLRYRYIGQDGPTIGLGVGDQADLFLTQEPLGRRPPQPTHVAFNADSRLIVRDCYTAALNAGGYPSGAPGYCNPEGTVFNAAFEDLDGNTIEVIYKDHADFVPPAVPKPVEGAEDDRLLGWQQEVPRSGSPEAHPPLSRARTVYDTSSRSKRGSSVPPQALGRARTEPVDRSSGFPKKAVFGTLIGAAATAMFAYAMNKSERENAGDEEEFSRSRHSKPSRRHSDAGHWQKTASSDRSRDFPTTHRYYQITEPSQESQPRLRRTQRTIEPTTTSYRDVEVEEAVTRRRRRSKPREIEGGRASSRSTRTSRRNDDDRSRTVDRKHYYIEGAPPASRMIESSRRSAQLDNSDNDQVPRRDSGVSVTSHRSHRSHRSRHSQYQPQGATRESESEVTVRPSKRSQPPRSAAGVALPPSRAASVARSVAKPAMTEYGPVDDPAPRPPEDESDGLDDFKTVVPDDSISCIDLSSRRKKSLSHRSHRCNVEDSRERRPRREDDRSRHSAMTMPLRSKPRPREQAYYLVRSDDDYQDSRDRRRRSAATYR